MNFYKSRFVVLVLVFAVLLTPLFIGWKSLYAEISKDMRQTTARELNLLSRLFIQEANQSRQAVENLLFSFSKEGVRISFIDEQGTVLYDSALTTERLSVLDNHATRQEIKAAQEFGSSSSSRYSNTLSQDLVYAAEKIPATTYYPKGTLRVAIPLESRIMNVSELVDRFFMALAAFFVLAIAVNYYLFRRFMLSLGQIQRVVENTAQPGAREKLALPQKPEFEALAFAVSEMTQRVDEQIQINASQSSELESIFNTLQAGVMVLDSRGYITKLNWAFTQLLPDYFGKDLSVYQGKKILGVINNSDISEKIHEMYQSESTFHTMEIQISGRMFQISIVKPENNKGVQIEAALVLVFHDITELTQLIQIKRDLVANVSHELRTPLTAIQGYTETLQSLFKEPELQKKQIEHFLETIIKNTRHLDRIVNDLLSLSSVENSDFENAQSTIDDAFKVAIEECQPLLDAKGITLENKLKLDTILNIDKDRLSQVFRNLLENACRYSPAGMPIVLASECIQGENENNAKTECTIYVQDFGPGIPQQELTRVFERFYRVEKHRSDAISTGLGLSICKHIVEKYNGSIHALYHAQNLSSDNTTAQVGATIRFSLPACSNK